jgi:cell division protein ZapA
VAKHTYTMSVLGSSFTLRSEDDVEYLRSVADYFTAKVAEVEKSLPAASPLRLAVLSALNIADELLKARKAARAGFPLPDPESEEIDAITERIISHIDDSLRE